MDIVKQMKLFMEPKSVAVLGASRRTGKMSFNAFQNILNFGFKGKIYPVNPSVGEILGQKVYPNIKAIPDDIDLALITTPYKHVRSLVDECVESGIRAIIVVSGGFADAGEEGKAFQGEIIEIARGGNARIIGPNSMGIANSQNRLNTAFVPEMQMKETSLGVICQSGLFFCGLPDMHLVGKIIDLGNCCDIGFADGLAYLEDDPATKLILLHIEGIKDGKRFMEISKRVSGKKPIFALKTGKSEAGAGAAQSHSGSMAGMDEVYDAVFKQCGIMRVNDLDEMQDMGKAFLTLPLMRGKRVAIATVTYGGGVSCLDACQAYNLEVAELSRSTINKIRELAPDWLDLKNPVDLGALNFMKHGLDKTLSITLEALLRDDKVDGITLILPAMNSDSWNLLETTPKLAMRYKEKPIVCWMYGNRCHEYSDELEKGGEIAAFPTIERAILALARLYEYGKIKKERL